MSASSAPPALTKILTSVRSSWAGARDASLPSRSLIWRSTSRTLTCVSSTAFCASAKRWPIRPKSCAPVGLRRCAVGRRRAIGQLRKVADQGLLRFGCLDGGLQSRPLVLELLDGILDALPLGGGDRIVAARHEHAAAVDRADLEPARRLALDADGAGNGPRGKVREHQHVVAGLEPDFADARQLGTGGKDSDRIDLGGGLDVGGLRARGERRQHQKCEHGTAHEQSSLAGAHPSRRPSNPAGQGSGLRVASVAAGMPAINVPAAPGRRRRTSAHRASAS